MIFSEEEIFKTKKRTCRGCKCFVDTGNGPVDNLCELGYEIKKYGTGEPYRVIQIPQEECQSQ